MTETCFRCDFKNLTDMSKFDPILDSTRVSIEHSQLIASNSANKSKKFMQSWLGMQKFNQSYRITTAHISPQSAKRPYSWDDPPLPQAPCTRITLRTESLLYESRLSPHSMGRSRTSKTPKYTRILLWMPSKRFSKFHRQSQNLTESGTVSFKSTAICRL